MSTVRSVTKTSLESIIRSVHYINAGQALMLTGDPLDAATARELSLVTICIIVLNNGFKVEGVSACVDPLKYDEAVGKQCAYDNAFEKLWQLEGYLLKQAMFEEESQNNLWQELAGDNDCGDGCKI